ncbi:nucleotide exchange factor GrpE [Methylacidimicrobium sp. B4]|uniref:nucleotide exchange factor GrpE n=1 Tax=Methylacidimicrobium sp. B4 TaxID=2796139 RepID=UPI001A8ED072|nr:nucleotide exchange factor GrpE [Methylacidimicrobium sp. B4]QSR85640.1 nucleotide exchange factor GrpE [Methylacidimicrobium sp. B4]
MTVHPGRTFSSEPPAEDTPAFSVVSQERIDQWRRRSQEADEMQDRLLRSLAEWENARKRMAKEKEEAIRLANTTFLQTLLPVIDNFYLGVEAAQNATDGPSIAQGMKMILSQLQTLLREEGVEAVEAVGQPFDPHRHEAVGFVDTEEIEEGTVATQKRNGYLYKGRLLRPALVYVARKPSSGADGREEGEETRTPEP